MLRLDQFRKLLIIIDIAVSLVTNQQQTFHLRNHTVHQLNTLGDKSTCIQKSHIVLVTQIIQIDTILLWNNLIVHIGGIRSYIATLSTYYQRYIPPMFTHFIP